MDQNGSLKGSDLLSSRGANAKEAAWSSYREAKSGNLLQVQGSKEWLHRGSLKGSKQLLLQGTLSQLQ